MSRILVPILTYAHAWSLVDTYNSRNSSYDQRTIAYSEYSSAKATAYATVAIPLALTAVTGAIVGARRPGQMKEIVDAAGFWLRPAELAEISAFFEKPAGSGKIQQLVSR